MYGYFIAFFFLIFCTIERNKDIIYHLYILIVVNMYNSVFHIETLFLTFLYCWSIIYLVLRCLCIVCCNCCINEQNNEQKNGQHNESDIKPLLDV